MPRRNSQTAPGEVSCEVDAAQRLVTITFTGVITLELVLSAQAQARARPGFDATFATLLDYTQADLRELDTGAVRRIAENTPVAISARRAFLVADDAAYGLARLFRALSDIAGRGDLVQVFRDRGEAMQWLKC